jgi:acyl-coenzyme A thioesterase PaaI-like protein
MNGFNFFKIYTSEDPKFKNNTLYCIFNGNEKLSFHHNTFHGGATTTIIDTLFGYLAVSA